MAGNCRGEFDQWVIEERDARLQGVRHRSAIKVVQHVVRQGELGIEKECLREGVPRSDHRCCWISPKAGDRVRVASSPRSSAWPLLGKQLPAHRQETFPRGGCAQGSCQTPESAWPPRPECGKGGLDRAGETPAQSSGLMLAVSAEQFVRPLSSEGNGDMTGSKRG